jgi:hypothetical protein
VVEGLEKYPGSQVLGIVIAACAIVDIVIDFVNVPLVEKAKCLWIGFGLLD